MPFPQTRLRRLRATGALRGLVRETNLSPSDFVYPMFVAHGIDRREPIEAMPGRRPPVDRPRGGRGDRGEGARHPRRAAVRAARRQGRGGLGGLGRRGHRAAGHPRDQGGSPGPARDHRPVPVRVHEPRSLRRRSAPATASVDNDATLELLARTADLPGPRRRGHRRAQRHDGRPRRRDPAGARRRRPRRHADPRLLGEVRLGLLRPVPRGRRLGARPSATAAATRWIRATATRRCARPGSTSRRAPTS